MPAMNRARDLGLRRSRALRMALGDEFRETRLAAGVSQQHVARLTGLSQSKVSRTERNVRDTLSIEEAAVHAEALGLRLHLKAYPMGSPARDAAQLRLLERFRTQIGDHFQWRAEVPVAGSGDLRAWDVQLDGPASVGIEAESRLHDIQATQRRVALKLRDGTPSVVVLLVAETRHNRAILQQHRVALLSSLPLGTGTILKTLRAGRAPERNGIVVL